MGNNKNLEKEVMEMNASVNFLIKLIVGIVVTVICFVPVEFYIAAKFLLNPQGFWQNFALLGIGIYVAGGAQILLFIIWVMLVIAIIDWDLG
ncbi:MAG: hypothetical protein COX43_01455 [Parcubacteria group bacterium CG23_combo_of_CG06-09_8_20_14_all_35_9]|nr:MAG: hypothetical protein COX43_01455 [Parcubacteria group bacterium CG23_combo_of_CG06-09_8_20_14_all_35_9]